MKIAIDAINIKSDGGITYLNEFLLNFNKKKINEINVYIADKSLIKTKSSKIKIIENKIFAKNFIITAIWKFLFLKSHLRKANCKKLIVMSGHYLGNFNPTFLVMQNALPFFTNGSQQFPIISRVKFIIQKISYIISIYRKNNVIFVSNTIKKKILKNFKKKIKYIVAHHGTSNQIFERKTVERKGVLKIIYVSQYSYHKNHKNLFFAIKQLNINGIRVTLDCYGQDLDGNLKKLKNYIKKNNIQGIKLNDSVDQKKLFMIYKKYDCHIFPSQCESFGLPLLESAKAGLLIICSNLKIFKELLNKSPIYFNPNSKNDMISALLKVIMMPKIEFNKKIAESLKISKTYLWKSEIKKIEKFIFKV